MFDGQKGDHRGCRKAGVTRDERGKQEHGSGRGPTNVGKV